MSSIVPKHQIVLLRTGIKKVLINAVHPAVIIPARNKVFYGAGHKHKGGLVGKRARRRWPINWRVVNFNPAQLPKAWKPKDYDEKHNVNYKYEEKLAQYQPWSKQKIHPKRRVDYHEEPVYEITDKLKSTSGFDQALALTKSFIIPGGLPEKIKQLKDDLPNPDDLVIKIMQNAILFDLDPCMIDRNNRFKRYKIDNYRQPTQQRYCPRILLDFIRLSDTHGCHTSDKFYDRMNVPFLQCQTWFERGQDELKEVDLEDLKKHWKISLSAKPFMQVLSKDPLPLFANEEAVNESTNKDAFTVYPQLPVSEIKPKHNYSLKHTTGLTTTWHKPHLHTIVLQCQKNETHTKVWGKLLVNLFCALHSHAMQLYGEKPQVLPRPLAAQGIASDGRSFYGMAFQLNTTDLLNDTGVKNMVWTSTEFPETFGVKTNFDPTALFERCSPLLSYEPGYYAGYSPDAFATFQALWLNGIL